MRLLRFGPFSFYRTALFIAVPVMLQQFIMSMVSLIDNFMVAGLGDVSMAAVNVANQINFIHIVFINVIAGAGGIYLAQFMGAKNEEGMGQAYRFKVLLGLAVSVLYFILCWTIPEAMLSVMTMGNAAQAEIVKLGSTYLRLTSFTLLPMVFSNAIGSSFREIGRPSVPLVISAASTAVNTIGNWLFIYGNLGAPRLGVSGAAIATVIARLVEMVVFSIYVYWDKKRGKAPFFVHFSRIFHVNWRFFREIMAKSAMMFLSDFSWISSETIMTALYNGRGGAEVVAGMAAAWTIANIFFLLWGGIFTTTAVLIGGSLGAGKLDEARKRAEWIKSGSTAAGFIIAIVGAGVSTLLIPLVFSSLTANARSISLGLVYIILFYMPFWALINSMWAISRAGGDTAMGMYADVSVNTFLFVPACFILALCTSIHPVSMFALVKLTDIVKYFIARHFLNKERWVRNLTIQRLSQN